MSIYYKIKEHLTIADTASHDAALDIFTSQLGLLGGLILNNNANIHKLQVVADGKEYNFSGNVMTESFHSILNAIRSAQSVVVCSEYDYCVSADSANPGPFAMMDFMDKLDSDDLDGIFYSAYNISDAAVDAGILVAYGDHNGHSYHGAVPATTVHNLPDGNWYAPQTAVVFDDTIANAEALEALEDICKQMCAFSEADELSKEDNNIAFYLNNLQISNDAQCKDFMRLCIKLNELTNGCCGFMLELVNFDTPNAQIAILDFDSDGNISIKLASVM